MREINTDNLIIGLAVIALFMIIPLSAHADVIFVSGDVSGTWSADSVIVSDSIYVSPGNTLEIQPGVDVLFLAPVSFRVKNGAVLRAIGTESDSISFLPAVQNYFSLGIKFENASDESILEYCRIADALYGAIEASDCDLTIRNCLIENNPGYIAGGGIAMNSNSNGLIENNMIRENEADGYGGGIYCDSSSPVIRGNIIDGNSAGPGTGAGGGGICCDNYSNPLIIDNTFLNNEVTPAFQIAFSRGGAIYCSDFCNPMIYGNIFINNHANPGADVSFSGGGAIHVAGPNPVIMNNIFVGNTASGDEGGAIYIFNSNVPIINNTFINNSAGFYGGCIYVTLSPPPTITNSILYGNFAPNGPEIYNDDTGISVTYSNILGGWEGEGNIDVDPLFRDPVSGDYHLMAIECGDAYDSPCIDAGDPVLQDSLLDCAWGLGTLVSDIGAYGGGDSALVGIDIPQTTIPAEFSLVQNYPNPFNASTIIRYELPVKSHLKIDIFDALGRQVTTLRDGIESAGYHQVVWDASDISSGMYFYKLQVNDYSEVKKTMLVK